jgi:hypothetical protein
MGGKFKWKMIGQGQKVENLIRYILLEAVELKSAVLIGYERLIKNYIVWVAFRPFSGWD